MDTFNVIIVVVFLLVSLVFGFVIGQESIVIECDRHGAFYISDTVSYTCVLENNKEK